MGAWPGQPLLRIVSSGTTRCNGGYDVAWIVWFLATLKAVGHGLEAHYPRLMFDKDCACGVSLALAGLLVGRLPRLIV
jgi:hypothetical protein